MQSLGIAVFVGAFVASNASPDLSAVLERLASLEELVHAQAAEIAALKGNFHSSSQRLRRWLEAMPADGVFGGDHQQLQPSSPPNRDNRHLQSSSNDALATLRLGDLTLSQTLTDREALRVGATRTILQRSSDTEGGELALETGSMGSGTVNLDTYSAVDNGQEWLRVHSEGKMRMALSVNGDSSGGRLVVGSNLDEQVYAASPKPSALYVSGHATVTGTSTVGEGANSMIAQHIGGTVAMASAGTTYYLFRIVHTGSAFVSVSVRPNSGNGGYFGTWVFTGGYGSVSFVKLSDHYYTNPDGLIGDCTVRYDNSGMSKHHVLTINCGTLTVPAKAIFSATGAMWDGAHLCSSPTSC